MPHNNEQKDMTFFKKSKELRKNLDQIEIQDYLINKLLEIKEENNPSLTKAIDILYNSIISDKIRNEFNYEINRKAEENNNNPYLTNRI